ncbi:MAG TPA: hypothetical protein ENF78_05455 [Candidatus Bathyarchaeota archaeon]|nr:hypothetical protein [Candidatus Bathyarchaeota archaeon]
MIRDELEEVFFLKEPIVSIVEWIPFGPHQFEHLISAITTSWFPTMERPSFLTDRREEEPRNCLITLESGMARIMVKDIREKDTVSFTADVYYPEAEGIRQIEQIGVNVFSNGLVICSSKITTVSYRGAKGFQIDENESLISLDRASRIVCDLIEDTSRLLSTLLTPYQRRILNIIYPLSELELYERKKLTFIFTEDLFVCTERGLVSLREVGDVEEILKQRKDARMEIQQLIGELQEVRSTPEAIVLKGLDGFLLILKDGSALIRLKERILLLMLFSSLNLFFKHLMARAWMIWDSLMRERKRCFERAGQADALKVRESLSEMLSNVVLLEDTCVTIGISVRRLRGLVERLCKDGQDILGILDPVQELESLSEKVEQAKNTLHALRTDIEGLIDIITTLVEEEMRQVRIRMDQNLEAQVTMMKIEQVESERLRLIEIFSGGLLAAELMALIIVIYEDLVGPIREFVKAVLTLAVIITFSIFFYIRVIRVGHLPGATEKRSTSGPPSRERHSSMVKRRPTMPLPCMLGQLELDPVLEATSAVFPAT